MVMNVQRKETTIHIGIPLTGLISQFLLTTRPFAVSTETKALMSSQKVVDLFHSDI
jgi:hypothetical protein